MIRLSKSVIGPEEQAAVAEILKAGYLGMGPEVRRFEEDLEAYLGGGKSVVCVNTGTAALHLAVQAAGIGHGDEVILPSLTFVACFQAIAATGAVPVACDVDLKTGQMDLADALKRVTPKTRALMPVHYTGAVMANLEQLYEVAHSKKLRVIEDAAHAFGTTYHGKRIGSMGDIVCFSFDGIKNITSGEGGAIVSSDSEVIRQARDARLLGVENDTEQRYLGKRSWEFEVSRQGWRFHMSEIMAAIGRAQLKKFEPKFKPVRMMLARRYRELLADVPGVSVFQISGDQAVVPHIFPIRIENGRREKIQGKLESEGIQQGLHYKPSHLLKKFGGGKISLPNAERLYREILTLPLHPEVSETDVEKIVKVIRGT